VTYDCVGERNVVERNVGAGVMNGVEDIDEVMAGVVSNPDPVVPGIVVGLIMVEVGSTGAKVIVPGSDMVNDDDGRGRTVETVTTVTVDRGSTQDVALPELKPQVIGEADDDGRLAEIAGSVIDVLAGVEVKGVRGMADNEEGVEMDRLVKVHKGRADLGGEFFSWVDDIGKLIVAEGSPKEVKCVSSAGGTFSKKKKSKQLANDDDNNNNSTIRQNR